MFVQAELPKAPNPNPEFITMITEPTLENRNSLPYVAITTQVTMPDIPAVLPPLIPKVFYWLQNNGINPSGPPFFRYLEMNGKTMQVAVGFPVAEPVAGNDGVLASSFPAGKYVIVRYQGPYSNLYQAHTFLENWTKNQNIETQGPHAEFYITDPVLEPNTEKWLTDIVRMVKC